MRVKKTRRGEGAVLAAAPRVYLGPDARRALLGRWGLLQGAKRPSWVDVLAFCPCARPRGAQVADLRFGRATEWTVVGFSLPEDDLRRREATLLKELVPGDVLITERGARVHLGDAWAPAQLLRDARG